VTEAPLALKVKEVKEVKEVFGAQKALKVNVAQRVTEVRKESGAQRGNRGQKVNVGKRENVVNVGQKENREYKAHGVGWGEQAPKATKAIAGHGDYPEQGGRRADKGRPEKTAMGG
jgi:hypothetical protein